jgi:hypothetical protein
MNEEGDKTPISASAERWYCVKFEVLLATCMKVAAFRNVALCPGHRGLGMTRF